MNDLKQERMDQAGEWPTNERRIAERRDANAAMNQGCRTILDNVDASRAMLPVTDGMQFLRNVVADVLPMLRSTGYPMTADVLEVAVNNLALASAPQQKPIARLQSYVSVRPYSEGQQFFEVVILDQERCADGMELFGTPVPAPATVPKHGQVRIMVEHGCVTSVTYTQGVQPFPDGLHDLWIAAPATVERDAVIEQCAKIAADFGPDRPIVSERPSDLIIGRWEGENAASANIAKAIRALKGKAAPAPVPQGVFALCRKCNGSGLNGRVGAAPECPACKGEGFAPQGVEAQKGGADHA